MTVGKKHSTEESFYTHVHKFFLNFTNYTFATKMKSAGPFIKMNLTSISNLITHI